MGYNPKVNEMIERRRRLVLRNKVKEEELLRQLRGLREEIGVKTYLHDPTDCAKTLKLPFSCRGREPVRRKRCSSGRGRRCIDVRPCGKAIYNTIHLWENVKCTRRNGMCQRR